MRARRTVRVVVLVLVMGLLAGACAGATGRAGSPSGPTPKILATFVAADGAASPPGLADDARQLTTRLHSFGDANATATRHGPAVVVSGTTSLPVPESVLIAPGAFQIRPALCQSGPYAPTTGAAPSPAGTVPTACSSLRYSLQAPNLFVSSAGNSNIDSIAPDPVLAPYPSSAAAYNDSHPDSSVLVPVTGDGGVRYLLGPTALNATVVADANATMENTLWLVDVRLSEPGASAWDAVAKKYFHEILAFDVDGVAVSAPLMQPGQATFTSFDGKMQVSGNFTKRSAQQLAAILASGPLTVPLSP